MKGSVFPDRFLAAVVPVDSSQLAPPARELLDHERTMTEVLAEYFGCELDLRVLEWHTDPESGVYTRRVVLVTRDGRRVVEHGWLSVELAQLPAGVARELVEGEAPFGRHLRTLAAPFRVEPDGWFRAALSGEVAEALGVRPGTWSVGRKSCIRAQDGRVLARAVEVLAPPASLAGRGTGRTG